MRLAILSSSEGELAGPLLQQVSSGMVKGCEPVCVITNANSSVAHMARTLGVSTQAFSPQLQEGKFFESHLLRALHEVRAELIVQLDWKVRTPVGVIDAYSGKIINHYSAGLDPRRDSDFGGDDMFDVQGIASSLAYYQLLGDSDMVMESSVHHVSREKYHGDLASSVTCHTSGLEDWSFFRGKPMVMANRAIASSFKTAVKDRVKSLQPYSLENVICALRKIVRADAHPIVRTSPLIDPNNREVLSQAKAIAQYTFPPK